MEISSHTSPRSGARSRHKAAGTPGAGAGLAGQYFNNTTLTGSPVLERVERVAFTWADSPGPGIERANQSPCAGPAS